MSAEDRKPGSWVVHHDEYAVGIGEVRNDGTSLNFADLHVGQFLGDRGRAMKRARLIAAAPGLLAALQKALEHCIWPASSISAAEAEARTAIANAKGEGA